jgi:hypothetical protein
VDATSGRLCLSSGGCTLCGRGPGVSGVALEVFSAAPIENVALELFMDNGGPGEQNNIACLGLGDFTVGINQDTRSGPGRRSVTLYHAGSQLLRRDEVVLEPGRYEMRICGSTFLFRRIDGTLPFNMCATFQGPAVTAPLCILVNEEPLACFDDIVVRDLSVPEPLPFQVPGDCNQDQGLDISDAVCVFGFLFLGQPPALPCGGGVAADAGSIALIDWQPDGGIDISDGIAMLGFLFGGGPPHPLSVPGAEVDACVSIAGCTPRCD